MNEIGTFLFTMDHINPYIVSKINEEDEETTAKILETIDIEHLKEALGDKRFAVRWVLVNRIELEHVHYFHTDKSYKVRFRAVQRCRSQDIPWFYDDIHPLIIKEIVKKIDSFVERDKKITEFITYKLDKCILYQDRIQFFDIMKKYIVECNSIEILNCMVEIFDSVEISRIVVKRLAELYDL